MNLTINSRLVIPSKEIQWRFSRSSGAGGQNINKTNSRVELVFEVEKSQALNTYQKYLIKSALKKKIINGCICIIVQEKRTQYQNRLLALYRLATTLKDCLKASTKKRIKTKPTRASQKKRVESKKKRGKVKKNRQYKIDE